MNIAGLILSALLKKGVMADLQNVETKIDIPDTNIQLDIKIEKMTVRILKGEEGK